MTKPLTVREIFAMPWGSPVPSVSGVIEHLHPPMIEANWSLQNGKLRDDRGGAVIEFMLSKHEKYWDPRAVVGQHVRIVGRAPDAMVWKGQKAKPKVNGGVPFAKLEVGPNVEVAWTDTEDSLFSFPSLQQTQTAPEAVPPAAVPPVPAVHSPVAKEPEGRGHKVSVRHELRQLIALYGVVTQEVERCPVVAEGARDQVAENVYSAACSQGLYRKIDPDGTMIELDPSQAAKIRPNLTALGEQFAGKEQLLDMLLRGNGTIRMDQSWRDLTEPQAAEALKSPEIKGLFAKAS